MHLQITAINLPFSTLPPTRLFGIIWVQRIAGRLRSIVASNSRASHLQLGYDDSFVERKYWYWYSGNAGGLQKCRSLRRTHRNDDHGSHLYALHAYAGRMCPWALSTKAIARTEFPRCGVQCIRNGTDWLAKILNDGKVCKFELHGNFDKYFNFFISFVDFRQTINVFLCITQLGFCCVYFVFVAVNLQEVVAHYFAYFDIRLYLLIMLIPMILLNFLKNLKYLTPVSLFASILTVTGNL